jgi:hypothetical protein
VTKRPKRLGDFSQAAKFVLDVAPAVRPALPDGTTPALKNYEIGQNGKPV